MLVSVSDKQVERIRPTVASFAPIKTFWKWGGKNRNGETDLRPFKKHLWPSKTFYDRICNTAYHRYDPLSDVYDPPYTPWPSNTFYDRIYDTAYHRYDHSL